MHVQRMHARWVHLQSRPAMQCGSKPFLVTFAANSRALAAPLLSAHNQVYSTRRL